MADNTVFSYTRRDYEGSRQEGLAKVPLLSQGTWTDLNATDPGVVILDYVHALADMIQYYQDHQALEAFLSTAKERSSIFRLAEALGYKVPSAKGAKVDVTFASELVYDYPVKIPKYTSLSTKTGIKYLTSEDTYMKAGSTSVVVPCIQGEIGTTNYTGTGLSRFSAAEGATNQYVILPDKNIDADTITIVDNSGRTWISTDNIVFSTSVDRFFEVSLLPDNTIRIQFGDGQRSIFPEATDILMITYVNTLADKGRVGANTIVTINEPIYDSYGNPTKFIVTNLRPSVGGSVPQSSEDIKRLAPGVIKSQGRAVTRSDFESLAKTVDGVSQAIAYDINVAPDLCLHHEVKVVIVPDALVEAPESLKTAVYNYLLPRTVPPTNLHVLLPGVVPVDIVLEVKLLDNLVEGGVDYEIRTVIDQYFRSRKEAFGEKFYATELIPIIKSVPGVRYVVSITPNESADVPLLSTVKLGSLTISLS